MRNLFVRGRSVRSSGRMSCDVSQADDPHSLPNLLRRLRQRCFGKASNLQDRRLRVRRFFESLVVTIDAAANIHSAVRKTQGARVDRVAGHGKGGGAASRLDKMSFFAALRRLGYWWGKPCCDSVWDAFLEREHIVSQSGERCSFLSIRGFEALLSDNELRATTSSESTDSLRSGISFSTSSSSSDTRRSRTKQHRGKPRTRPFSEIRTGFGGDVTEDTVCKSLLASLLNLVALPAKSLWWKTTKQGGLKNAIRAHFPNALSTLEMQNCTSLAPAHLTMLIARLQQLLVFELNEEKEEVTPSRSKPVRDKARRKKASAVADASKRSGRRRAKERRKRRVKERGGRGKRSPESSRKTILRDSGDAAGAIAWDKLAKPKLAVMIEPSSLNRKRQKRGNVFRKKLIRGSNRFGGLRHFERYSDAERGDSEVDEAKREMDCEEEESRALGALDEDSSEDDSDDLAVGSSACFRLQCVARTCVVEPCSRSSASGKEEQDPLYPFRAIGCESTRPVFSVVDIKSVGVRCKRFSYVDSAIAFSRLRGAVGCLNSHYAERVRCLTGDESDETRGQNWLDSARTMLARAAEQFSAWSRKQSERDLRALLGQAFALCVRGSLPPSAENVNIAVLFKDARRLVDAVDAISDMRSSASEGCRTMRKVMLFVLESFALLRRGDLAAAGAASECATRIVDETRHALVGRSRRRLKVWSAAAWHVRALSSSKPIVERERAEYTSQMILLDVMRSLDTSCRMPAPRQSHRRFQHTQRQQSSKSYPEVHPAFVAKANDEEIFAFGLLDRLENIVRKAIPRSSLNEWGGVVMQAALYALDVADDWYRREGADCSESAEYLDAAVCRLDELVSRKNIAVGNLEATAAVHCAYLIAHRARRRLSTRQLARLWNRVVGLATRVVDLWKSSDLVPNFPLMNVASLFTSGTRFAVSSESVSDPLLIGALCFRTEFLLPPLQIAACARAHLLLIDIDQAHFGNFLSRKGDGESIAKDLLRDRRLLRNAFVPTDSVAIVFGNRYFRRKREGKTGSTKRWLLFVEPKRCEEATLKAYVSHVQFLLDPALFQEPNRELSHDPFQVVGCGRMSFHARIVVHFKPPNDKRPLELRHELCFDAPVTESVVRVILRRPVVHEASAVAVGDLCNDVLQSFSPMRQCWHA